MTLEDAMGVEDMTPATREYLDEFRRVFTGQLIRYTADQAIDVDGEVFSTIDGNYTGEKVTSIDGRIFRFMCDTCCSVYQLPLEQKVTLNDGTTRPICKFCK
jgi:hypothetical protein